MDSSNNKDRKLPAAELRVIGISYYILTAARTMSSASQAKCLGSSPNSPFPCCVTVGELATNSTEPQFPHLQNGDNMSTHLRGAFERVERHV